MSWTAEEMRSYQRTAVRRQQAERQQVARRRERAGELARQALKAYERALELQRQGNWAGYGAQLRSLEDILRRLAK